VALIARFLIDTRAAARMRIPAVAARLAPLIEAGVVATCATLDAEALFSARNSADYEQLWADRRSAYEYLPTATLAAEHGLTLVHYDADFDTAATVLTFDHRWVAPRGGL